MRYLQTSQNCSRLLLKPLRAAIIACSLGAVFPQLVWAQPAADAVNIRFDIPAGPLDAALNRFGRQTGVLLSVDAAVTRDLSSPGVHGEQSVGAGLQQLLIGTGLEAVRAGDGSYSLRKLPKAQDVKLRAVKVSANVDEETATGPVVGYVARRTVTATKTDTPLIESPQSISVVTRDQMDAQNAQSVSDALRYSAGVLAEANGPDPRADNIVMRGFDAGRDAYRDGLRSYAFGNQGGSVYEPYGMERIEVLRGPSSILYGQGGAGGIVNLVSKRPTAQTVRELQAQVGSYDRKQLAADFGGGLTAGNEWTYRLIGLVRDSDTFIDHVTDDRTYLAPALTWQPDDDTSLTLLSDFQKNKKGQGYQALPRVGTLDSNPNGRIPTHRFVGEPDFDKFGQKRASVGYIFEHRFNEQFTVRQNARYQTLDTDYKGLYIGGLQSDNRTVTRYADQGREKVENKVIDNQLQFKWSHGIFEHTSLVGLDWQRLKSDPTYYYGEPNDLDVYAPVYGQWDQSMDMSWDAHDQLKQTGIYLQDQIKVDKTWVATLGLRRDSTEKSSKERLTPVDSRQKDYATTARAGLVYLSSSGLAPYISYSESFAPVVGTTFDGSQFEPETGKQYEIGLRYQPADTTTSITAAVFDLTRQNVTTEDLQHVGFSVQRGEVRARGFELEAKASLATGWDVLTSYAYTDAEITKSNDGNEGNTPGTVPQNTASVWLQYTVLRGDFAGLSIAAGERYIGSFDGDDANTIRVPEYTLADLSLQYDFSRFGKGWRGLRGALNVSNLFDKEYVATCGYYGDACRYGYRRNAMATLNYDW